jgi:hypothetical protein
VAEARYRGDPRVKKLDFPTGNGPPEDLTQESPSLVSDPLVVSR